MLQRAGNLKFQTIEGVLAHQNEILALTDDNNDTYVIETGRMGVQRLDHLIGARVEIKGLVDAVNGQPPIIHVIYVKG